MDRTNRIFSDQYRTDVAPRTFSRVVRVYHCVCGPNLLWTKLFWMISFYTFFWLIYMNSSAWIFIVFYPHHLLTSALGFLILFLYRFYSDSNNLCYPQRRFRNGYQHINCYESHHCVFPIPPHYIACLVIYFLNIRQV